MHTPGMFKPPPPPTHYAADLASADRDFISHFHSLRSGL